MAIIAQPTQAIQEDFGGIVQQGVATIQATQERERLKKEAEYQKMLDFEDRYGIDESLWQLENTGVRTVDDVTTEALAKSRDAYYETYKALQKDPTNLELKKKLGRIKNSVTQMGKTHEKFIGLSEEFLTKLENDEVSGVDEEELTNLLTGVDEGRVSMQYDDNFNMNVLVYDKNGRLEMVKPYNDLMRKTVTKRIDVDDTVDAMVKTMGRDKETTISNGMITKTDVFGERQRQTALNWIESQIGKEGDQDTLEQNDVLADLLNQATNGVSKKKENFTEQERAQVREFLMNEVENRYSNTTDKSRDPLAIQNARTAAAARNSGVIKGDVTINAAAITGEGGEDAPRVDNNGNIEFSVSRAASDGAYEPIEIKTDNSDIFVSTIGRNKEGNLSIKGNQRVKMAGTFDSQDKAEKAAEEEFGSFLRVSQDKVTGSYYAVIDYEDDDPTLLNNIANQLKMGDLPNMRRELDTIAKQRFGVDSLEDFYKKNKAKGEVKYDAFGNPIE